MAASLASIRRHACWRALGAAMILAGALFGVLSTGAVAAPAPATPACTQPVLILSAMPLELNPLVAKASLDPARTVHVDGRTFYVGQLAGNDVVMALTGIGPVNATETAQAALSHFACPFRAVVFSGVAGSQAFIGDVMVPQRWTMDSGKTWVGVDAAMLATADHLERPGAVALSQDVPVGDAACLCSGVDAATPVHVPHVPQVLVGGSGETSDPFGGHAVPCVWGGGDIAGCEPCLLWGNPVQDSANFAGNAPSLADPGFLTAFLQPPAQTTTTMAVQDEETAAVAEQAHRYGVPFLGIRAVSDGQGDPLHLPGFPFQFFVYRQLAGNNAAAATIAFLQTWTAAGRPT